MEDKKEITEFIEYLGKIDFYGSIELKFEKGNVVHLRKIESLKPEDLSATKIIRKIL